MDLTLQIAMGFSLAACTGMRAFLPVFIVGLLARTGHLPLNPSYAFLGHNSTLIIFGVATVLEFLGDKIIAVDHFLDAIGTVARPVIGFLLTASLLTKTDPAMTLAIGLILGGGSAFTIHTGKAILRAKSSALVPLHGGLGNAALSTGEDILAGVGTALAVIAPLIAAFLALIALLIAILLIMAFVKTGRRLFQFLQNRRDPTRPTSTP